MKPTHKTILSCRDAVTLLGGGDVDEHLLSSALERAPTLVAADGAAAVALKYGHMPEAVIGDFDSLDTATRGQIDPAHLHHIAEQDSTDFEKCLSRIKAPLILGVGFMGGRIDHELAVYSTLVRYPDTRCIIIGAHDVICAAPARLTLELAVGTRVSLFPMGPVTGRSTGLRWPIEGLTFAPSGQIGTSNEVTAPEVCLELDGAGMLLILPRSALDVLSAALML